jgi:hypothetical protein
MLTLAHCALSVAGVGKSTNLAKICYWLLQNDNRVLIAACDTFRAGAVEQLRTHVRKLTDTQKQTGKLAEVKLYEKGYGKDPAGIAEEAIIFGAYHPHVVHKFISTFFRVSLVEVHRIRAVFSSTLSKLPMYGVQLRRPRSTWC